jgi:signal transduction histidine kinase
MDLTLPLMPVYLVDTVGSVLSVGLAVSCVVCSRKLTRMDQANALWTYLLWISVAFATFTIFRSTAHLFKYLLVISGHKSVWETISPVAGGIISATFIFVATLTFYYERVKRSYKTIVMERDRFEAAKDEIALLNRNLGREVNRIKDAESKLEMAHEEISRLIDQVRSGGDLSVRYHNPGLVHCWEVKNCVYEDCPAYNSDNLRCWHVGYAFCCSKKDMESGGECKCDLCAIYTAAHQDLLSKLGERFNDMMYILEKKSNELQEANLNLKEMDQRKSKFLDIVAHDLRTPLTSILSYADLLLRYKNEPEETKDEFLRTIIFESRRLGELINDYLDLSKIESGLLEYHLERLNFREVIDHTVSVYSGTCMKKGVQIETHGIRKALILVGDKNRLTQVMSNLMSNAAKFTPDNGHIHIHAKFEENGKFIHVKVSDNGPGVPEVHLKEIFKKFAQVQHEDLHTVGGSGLGLPICEEIILYHEGRIWAENSEEGGAAFHFLLPVQGPSFPRLKEMSIAAVEESQNPPHAS